MPDQWGRPQMNDWTGIMQAINTYGSIQDRNKTRWDRKGVEAGMSDIASQQADGTALKDMTKPGGVSERQWAEALSNKHSLAAMDEQRKSAEYNRWYQDFKKNKDEAQKTLAVLKGQKDTGVTENQRKEALFDFYNKHVYDNQRYAGTETKKDGSVVHVFENAVNGRRIEQPDSTADEMLWAAEDYLGRWFDKTAPVARSKRIEKNRQGLLNPIEMVNDSGDVIYLYPQVKRGSDGYEPVMVRKNPAKEADPQDPMDFVETTVEEWVAKGYKANPKLNKEAIEVKRLQTETDGKKASQIHKSMDFIAEQLGVVPDKKGSGDDIMALAMGEDESMPEMSTLKGILNKMEGGSNEEKALATSWMQMAGELYPGLKNIQDGDQKQGRGNASGDVEREVPTTDDDFSLGDADSAEIVKAAQAKKAKLQTDQDVRNSKKSRDIDRQHPGLSESINKYSPQQDAAPNMALDDRMPVLTMQEAQDYSNSKLSRAIDAQHPGFSESLNRYSPNAIPVQGTPAPHESLPAPFQYNPDKEALDMIRTNRPRR